MVAGNSYDIAFHLEWNTSKEKYYGDKNQIKQLLLNLSLNSIEAIEKNGTIKIEIAFKENNSSFADSQGSYEIHFKDSGPGIPDEYRDIIFNPFVTTKQTGTGLGLFIAYGIVKQHIGEIELKETNNQGTCFKILLPWRHYGKDTPR